MATLEAIQGDITTMRVALAFTLVALAAVAGCSRSNGDIRGSGTVELNEIDVASLVGGRISRVLVDEGDSVSAGDTLVVLAQGEVTAGVRAQEAEAGRAADLARDQELGPRVEERRAAKADLDTAEAALRLAEIELARIQALYQKQLIPKADLDRTQTQRDQAAARQDAAAQRYRMLENGYRKQIVDAARKGAEVARAGLQSARSKARELVLTAPISGVVLVKSAEEGEVLGPAIPILTLGDPTKLWMRVYIAAPLLVRVHLGDRVLVSVQGNRREYVGRVVEIATRAEFTPRAALTEEERATIVFGVKVALDPQDGTLKPGLPADARIVPGS